MSEEIRVTNEKTGGQKGSKPERFDLIPIGPLTELARHYGRGAEKYEPSQWRKGYDWSLSYAAMQRHLTAFWGGEDNDPELGFPHMVAVAWHAFTLLEFMESCPELDDRFKEQEPDVISSLFQVMGSHPWPPVLPGRSVNESTYIDAQEALRTKIEEAAERVKEHLSQTLEELKGKDIPMPSEDEIKTMNTQNMTVHPYID